MERSYQKHSKGDLESILKESNNLNHKDNEHSILRQFIQDRMDTTLEEALNEDTECQKATEKARRKMAKTNRDKFTQEQWEIIDEALIVKCNPH